MNKLGKESTTSSAAPDQKHSRHIPSKGFNRPAFMSVRIQQIAPERRGSCAMSLQFVACVLSSTCAWATEYHWIYQQGSSAEDAIRSATSDSAGDIVGSGYTLGDFSTANEGQQDIIVVKVSSTGALLWSVQKSTEYEERSYAVSVDSSDSIFVAGYTFGEMDLEANAGTSDARFGYTHNSIRSRHPATRC